MNDPISRQAAIVAIHNEFDECCVWDASGVETADEVEKILNYVPSAESEWIPVTERLPMKNGSYLVWMPFTLEGHHITVAEWCDSYWNIKTLITAWMPLPEPYKEAEHDGEWISKMAAKDGEYAGWICSKCGYFTANSKACFYNYCPNCGKKMREDYDSD